jgi:hypothetical protein
MTDFSRTVVAADKWLRNKPLRDAEFNQAFNKVSAEDMIAAFEAAQANQKIDDDELREAFYQDTQAFNSRDNCMRVDTAFIRRCADEFRKQEETHGHAQAQDGS